MIGGGVVLVALYALLFFIPKPVTFSYAAESCIGQFVLAPGLQKGNSDQFDVQFENPWKIGSLTIATTKLCVTPKEAPQSGTYSASVSPFGGLIARKHLAVTVPEAPAINKADFIGRAISNALPLKISLSSPDTLHTYSIKVGDKSSECQQSDAELSCDIASLGLAHGTKYEAALYQSFKDEKKKVVEGGIETLQPVVLANATVANDQTFYDKPTSFSFTFDQPVKDSDVELVKVNGDATEPISIKKELKDATLTVQFEELPRDAQYRIEIKQVEAENGSSLAAPIATIFKMSGGPKVTGVSAGANSVARAARIIVTFDQPIDAGTDIAKLARAQGLAATVTKQSDTQLAFAIQGGDCTAFSLTIDKGVKSASNGELSKDAWNFSSRTICGTSWSIGTSVKGRPIIAYSFGSGATTILFTGAIHGSEPSSYSTMLAWAQYLQANGNIVPANKRVVIVPNTNPDGIAAGSRNNSRNVNLGRNFPTANWKAAIETASGVLPTGGGTSAGSEPETAALIALTRQLRPRLEVSFHAQGSLVGANKFGDSVSIGNVYANTVGYRTMYYDAEAVMGYPMTGEYEDWMGEEMGIPAILIELPTSSGNYLNSQLNALKKMINL